MTIHVPVFVTGDERGFENSVPLRFHGRYLADRGWKNPITAVVFEGYERLSAGYLSELSELGYTIVDYSARTAEINKDYAALTLNKFHYYTYLRWIIFGDMVARGQAQLPFTQIDGDVIFTVDPGRVLTETRAKTFVIQGCPCYTAIADAGWFAAFAAGMDRVLHDEAQLTRDAANLLANPVRPPRGNCNALAYGVPIRHDQDLLQYLIGAGDLAQDSTASILSSQFYWIQNPLYPDQWHQEQAGAQPHLAHWRDGALTVAGREIPFIHYQNDFAGYCARWMLLNRLTGHQGGAEPPADWRRALTDNRIYGGVARRLPGWSSSATRLQVAQQSLAVGASGIPPILEIINSRWAA